MLMAMAMVLMMTMTRDTVESGDSGNGQRRAVAARPCSRKRCQAAGDDGDRGARNAAVAAHPGAPKYMQRPRTECSCSSASEGSVALHAACRIRAEWACC